MSPRERAHEAVMLYRAAAEHRRAGRIGCAEVLSEVATRAFALAIDEASRRLRELRETLAAHERRCRSHAGRTGRPHHSVPGG